MIYTGETNDIRRGVAESEPSVISDRGTRVGSNQTRWQALYDKLHENSPMRFWMIDDWCQKPRLSLLIVEQTE